MQRVLNALEIHASERGEDIAVRDADGTAHSWRAVADGVRRVQRWAQSVAAPGGFVAVSMPSGGAAWIAVLGVSRAGCVPVLLPASVAENTERMVRASIGVPPRIDPSTWPDVLAHAAADSSAVPGAECSACQFHNRKCHKTWPSRPAKQTAKLAGHWREMAGSWRCGIPGQLPPRPRLPWAH